MVFEGEKSNNAASIPFAFHINVNRCVLGTAWARPIKICFGTRVLRDNYLRIVLWNFSDNAIYIFYICLLLSVPFAFILDLLVLHKFSFLKIFLILFLVNSDKVLAQGTYFCCFWFIYCLKFLVFNLFLFLFFLRWFFIRHRTQVKTSPERSAIKERKLFQGPTGYDSEISKSSNNFKKKHSQEKVQKSIEPTHFS